MKRKRQITKNCHGQKIPTEGQKKKKKNESSGLKRKVNPVKSHLPQKKQKLDENHNLHKVLNRPQRTLTIRGFPDITKQSEIMALSPDIENVVMRGSGKSRIAILGFRSVADAVKNIELLRNQRLHDQMILVQKYTHCEVDPEYADFRRLYVRLYGATTGNGISFKQLVKKKFPESKHVFAGRLGRGRAIVSFKEESQAKAAKEKYQNSFDFCVHYVLVKTTFNPRYLFVKPVNKTVSRKSVMALFPDALFINICKRTMSVNVAFETEEQCQKAKEENAGNFEVLRNIEVKDKRGAFFDLTMLSLECLTEGITEEVLKQDFPEVKRITFHESHSRKKKSVVRTAFLSFPSTELSKKYYKELKVKYPSLRFANTKKNEVNEEDDMRKRNKANSRVAATIKQEKVDIDHGKDDDKGTQQIKFQKEEKTDIKVEGIIKVDIECADINNKGTQQMQKEEIPENKGIRACPGNFFLCAPIFSK